MAIIPTIQTVLLIMQIAFAVASVVLGAKSTSIYDKYDSGADKCLYTSYGCCILLLLLNLFYLF